MSTGTRIGEKVHRPCYVCGNKPNSIIAEEVSEVRGGLSVMPEGVYVFIRCAKCSCLYVDSDVTEAHLTALYSGEASNCVEQLYGANEAARHERGRKEEFERHWAFICKVRHPKPGERLLDVGCQTGSCGLVAMKYGIVPDGIDLSVSHAEYAKSVWPSDSSVYCGPLAMAMGGGRKYAYVTAFEILEHALDPVTILRDLRALLSDDGLLAISVPSTDYFYWKYWLLKVCLIKDLIGWFSVVMGRRAGVRVLPHTHIYNFSSYGVRRVLEMAGYSIVAHKVTGWGCKGRWVISCLSRLLFLGTGKRFAFAPSHFVLAKVGVLRPDGGVSCGKSGVL